LQQLLQDGRTRCPWSYAGMSADYVRYHDDEWGMPAYDERRQFEFLILEGAQAGLSWSTILNKRAGYREAFADFDPERVARFNKRSVEKLMLNPRIVRNRLKIEAAINNARRVLEVQDELGSFSQYLWSFVGGKPLVNRRRHMRRIPATTRESDAASRSSTSSSSSRGPIPSKISSARRRTPARSSPSATPIAHIAASG